METNNIQNDLSLTVQELSGVYEELSLLYRISEIYSTLSIDEICSRIVDEAISTIGVRTAAVLFLDEQAENLYTMAYKGEWDCKRQFARDNGILWNSIQAKKPSAFCRIKETEHSDYIPGISSLMVCPILGKKKAVGAIVVADKAFE